MELGNQKRELYAILYHNIFMETYKQCSSVIYKSTRVKLTLIMNTDNYTQYSNLKLI